MFAQYAIFNFLKVFLSIFYLITKLGSTETKNKQNRDEEKAEGK